MHISTIRGELIALLKIAQTFLTFTASAVMIPYIFIWMSPLIMTGCFFLEKQDAAIQRGL